MIVAHGMLHGPDDDSDPTVSLFDYRYMLFDGRFSSVFGKYIHRLATAHEHSARGVDHLNDIAADSAPIDLQLFCSHFLQSSQFSWNTSDTPVSQTGEQEMNQVVCFAK